MIYKYKINQFIPPPIEVGDFLIGVLNPLMCIGLTHQLSLIVSFFRTRMARVSQRIRYDQMLS